MHIYEPMTAATDLLLAIAFFAAAILLQKRWQLQRQCSEHLWEYAMYAMSVASALAAIAHGPGRDFIPIVLTIIWKSTLCLIGIAAFLMLVGACYAVLKGVWCRVIIGLGALQVIVYAIWIITQDVGFDDFLVVVVNYGLSLLMIFVLTSIAYVKRHDPWAGWIGVGILFTFIPAAVQQSGIVLHKHLNYNDLYHLLSLVTVYLLYRGARLMRDVDSR